jgi:hypothetical protein
VEDIMEAPQKTKTRTAILSNNATLGRYPKEGESGHNKGICTPTFIAALFTIAKLWKQPRYLLLIKGLRKCGIYIQWNFIQPQKMKFCHLQVN